MILNVTEAKYIENYKLLISFNNNISKIVDLKDTILNDHRTIFKTLENVEYFKKFHIDYGTICWENGLDLAPEYLLNLDEVKLELT
jgi:hypothetical protein